MKKNLLLLLAAFLSLMVIIGCTKEETAGDPKVAESSFSIALVTDTGGIDDRSFNQGTWEGVLRVAKDVNAATVYAQSNSDADYIPNLSTFAEDGHDIIVAPGFLFSEAIAEVAKNFPSQQFLIIDTVVSDRPNVVSAVFAEHEGSFLVGVAAGQAAKDAGKSAVGFIGGGDFGLIQKFEAGFEQGVAAVDPGIKVLIDYVGGFSDAGKGQSIASKMYDEGAYVIYHAAGGAGNGLIKESKDRRKNGQDVWAIGVDRDQYEEGLYENGKSAVLTSMVKRVDVAAEDVCKLAYEKKFPGGTVIEFNMKNGGVNIPSINPNLPDATIQIIHQYQEKIKSGEIAVDPIPLRIKNK